MFKENPLNGKIIKKKKARKWLLQNQKVVHISVENGGSCERGVAHKK